MAPSSRIVVASDADVIEAADGVVPENASTSERVVLRNFDKWMKETGMATSSEPVPQDLLHCNPVIVSKRLCKFILETRQRAGTTILRNPFVWSISYVKSYFYFKRSC